MKTTNDCRHWNNFTQLNKVYENIYFVDKIIKELYFNI